MLELRKLRTAKLILIPSQSLLVQQLRQILQEPGVIVTPQEADLPACRQSGCHAARMDAAFVVDGARTRVDVVVQHPLLSIVGTLRPQTGTLHPWLRGPSGCATALAWVGTPAALCWLRQHGDGHSSPQGSDRFFSTSSGKERRTTRWAIPVCTLLGSAGRAPTPNTSCFV